MMFDEPICVFRQSPRLSHIVQSHIAYRKNQSNAAITDISISAPLGSPETSTVSRAG